MNKDRIICSGCWKEMLRKYVYDAKEHGCWCEDCIKCISCQRKPKGEKVFFYDFNDGIGEFANFGQKKKYLLCKECNKNQQEKNNNKEKQTYCLQCQKKTSVKEWIYFCGQSCCQKWIIENTNSFHVIGGDKGGECKKCGKKITDKTNEIDIDDVVKYVEHSKKCSGQKENEKNGNDESKRKEKNNQSQPFDNNCSQCVKKLEEAKEYIKNKNSEDGRSKIRYRLKSNLVCCHKSKCICQGGGGTRKGWTESINCDNCDGWIYYEVGGFGCGFTEIEPHKCDSNNNPNNPINIVQLLDQLERYFIENDIKLIKRENGKLVIEFNGENRTNNLTTEQQEQISNYLTRTNKNELSLNEVKRERERERERENNNTTNWKPWVIGGGIIAVVGIIGYLVWKSVKGKK